VVFLRRSFLILFALVLGGGQMFAVSEQRAFAAAAAAFQAKMWSRAETEFSQFKQNFPNSTNAPQAILLQAQSEFQQNKFADAIELLKANQPSAKNLEDQFVYWIGESQFASGNYLDAADTFISLAQNFSDSSYAARGIVEAASSLAKLNNWPAVESLVGTNSVILNQKNADVETVARGQLLLAQAKFEQKDFGGAANVLESINPKTLPPDLEWQRADLLCRVIAGAGDLPGALAVTTNLLQIAHNGNLAAEVISLRGDLFQKSDLPNDAIAEYQKNLKASVPLERQREAILKIAQLMASQNQFTNATQSLAGFLQQFSNAPVADMALLTLGEFHLKNYAADHSATNELQEARARFDQFFDAFTNSALIGKAYLDRGWCNLFAGNNADSLDDFKSAAQKLPPSEDLAVARFKIGDALFGQNDFKGARENYSAVLELTNFPAVANGLAGRALYQVMRASVESKDLVGASRALAQLINGYARSESLQSAELLYGESLADLQKPSDARETYQTFEQQWPTAMRPQVEFAIARTYELETNWPAAIEKYQNWLAAFPTNDLWPRTAYSLAWANFQGGNETNALNLFTNFVARFPDETNLASQAQWWIADHFYRAGDFVDAEKNYELIYQNFATNDLIYPARLMAGYAAVARQDYNGAIRDYFGKLEEDTNCPSDLRVQATFAHGDALMHAEPENTNSPLANFQRATKVFGWIVQLNPTNAASARAWVQIGDCDLQLGNFDDATNAYAQAANLPAANISVRNQAQIGIGIVLEKKAEQFSGDDKKALLQSALNNYLDVFDTAINPGKGEMADAFWVKKAGLQALPLIQTLGVAAPDGFIDEMEKLLPQLKDSLEKKRTELSLPKS
jgi:TolA-binding protein